VSDDLARERLIELAEGVYVEPKTNAIAQKIKEYDENLRLQYLDPSHFDAGIGDAPWRIVEVCRDGLPRVLFSVWELDDRVLEKIWAADTQRQDIQAAIEKKNIKAREDQNRRYQEEREQEQDIVVSYLRSSKGRWKFKNPRTGKMVQLDDDPMRRSG
jgi:hypothetical protein